LFDTDAQFHEMIAEFSGNVFFLQSIQQQNRLRRLLEFGGYTNRRRVKDWCREHVAILDAIASGQRERGAQLMTQHLQAALSFAPQYGAS
jgi:DNA-binding GntR family transcriptional regulator